MIIRRLRFVLTFLTIFLILFLYLLASNYEQMEYIPYLHLPSTDGDRHRHDDKTAAVLPVLVSGVSLNHYHESQGLVHSVHRYLPFYKLIIYDLGLEHWQREQLIKYCRCEVRVFQFRLYPPHVANLRTYAFKPIIVNQTIHEFGFVFWMDASVRFKSSDVSETWKLGRVHEVVAAQEDYVASCLIHPSMYSFFQIENPAVFRKAREIAATLLLVHATTRTLNYIIKPWLTCALNEKCISPPGHQLYGCKFELAPKYCDCHRYDQSALNIILYRLHPEELQFDFETRTGPVAPFSIGLIERVYRLKPEYDVVVVRKEHKVRYFPD